MIFIKKIYKYELKLAETQSLKIPSKEILSAQVQDKWIVIYAVVDDSIYAIEYEYTFKVFATGDDIKNIDEFKFLNTVSLINKEFYHIFYKSND